MRRAVARGRVFPQSYSTDRRYGRLSLKAVALFPLLWVNADDQGRLCGDPEEVKYTCCPNIDHVTKADIPELLKELERNELLRAYDTAKSKAIQLLDWWEVQRPQWAYPSQYLPPEGWKDRLRFHPTPTEIVTENWVSPGQFDRELPSTLPSAPKGGLRKELRSALRSQDKALPQTLSTEKKEYGKGNKEEGIRKVRSSLRSTSAESSGERPGETGSGTQVSDDSPSGERSGENPHPHHLVLSEQDKGIYETLKENYRMRWGRVPAENPDEIIPRPLQAKAGAQLRDLAIELSAAGGCPADTIKQAFDEACGQQKYSISYVRAILLDWLGIKRIRSP